MSSYRTSLFRLFSMVMLAGVVAGCASRTVTGAPDVDKTAFGTKKRYAVVSIASLKTFTGERSLIDTFRSADNVAGANTQPVINQLNAKIISALAHSRQFTLVPEGKVLANRSYRSLDEDERKAKILFFSDEINVANQYKYFSEPQKFAKLAQDLGVDGVIGITMTFGVTRGGGRFMVNGLSFGKKTYSAMAGISAEAYNKKGELIWKDSTLKEAEPGDEKAVIGIDLSAFSGSNFEKLHPSAVEIGGKAVDVLLVRLDDTLAGKDVEGVQKVK